MDENVYQILDDLGLDRKFANVYLACLELGGEAASTIAQKAGVERANTYYILEQLSRKGLVYSATRDNVTIFVAQSPKRLESMAEARLSQVKKALPELMSIENSGSVKPRVRFYEGIDGIKQMFEETLDLPRGSETLAYSSFSVDNKYVEKYIEGYIPRRVKKGITQRCIIEYSADSIDLIGRDKAELRESRMVDPEKFPFSNQINIFGNKMFIASYKDLMGVIIESAEVVRTQRAIFELAWLGAGRHTTDGNGE